MGERRKQHAIDNLNYYSVTIKMKSRLWKAVIVNLQPEVSSTKRKAQASKVDASEQKKQEEFEKRCSARS